MSRLKLWHIFTALAAVLAVVGFFVGYLEAGDAVPDIAEPNPAAAPPQYTSGVVTSISGDSITVDAGEGNVFTIDAADVSGATLSAPGTWDDIEPGDTLILGIETNELGGRALRAAVVVDSEETP